MTDTFTASNGIPVKLTNDRRLIVENLDGTYPATIAAGDHVEALREFFHHEKDEALGRWRSTADPRWTAVRRETVIYFQCEDGERSFNIVLGHPVTQKSWAPDLQAIAREYLEAHPEPKPAWHEAKEGEVWAVTVGVGPTFAAKVETDMGFPRFIDLADDMSYGPRSGITEARCIWPAEVSGE